jgi:beta-galactosidase beta subunit
MYIVKVSINLNDNDMKHIAPAIRQPSFHCPHCGVLAEQTWSANIHCSYEGRLANGTRGNTSYALQNTMTAKCSHCQQTSFWVAEKMVYPLTGNVEMANPDLPDDIKNDYNEAKDIVNVSPRGAAALLRLAVQKLCIHLGEKGSNINDDIKSLVKKGLPATMQQALDSVRVIGNNAVHPGTIDLNDNIEIAYALFGFVNIICEMLISQPKKVKEYYEKHIPVNIRTAIEKRDS